MSEPTPELERRLEEMAKQVHAGWEKRWPATERQLSAVRRAVKRQFLEQHPEQARETSSEQEQGLKKSADQEQDRRRKR